MAIHEISNFQNLRTCYRCAKIIKSKLFILVVPPIAEAQFTGDFTKAFHKRCYALSEKEAAKELANT